MFQFLIVQLKEKVILQSLKIENVSIPYSTIKRSVRIKTCKPRGVSIPYSTIKSTTANDVIKQRQRFNSL